YSCGGVIGNIKKYSFPDIDSTTLNAALIEVYQKYPTLTKNSKLYGRNNGIDFFYILDDNGNKCVFLCNIIVYPPPDDKGTDLTLTTATTWGKPMYLATKLGFWEKRKYEKLFEKNILPEIKEA